MFLRLRTDLMRRGAVLACLVALHGTQGYAAAHYVALAGQHVPPFTNWAQAATNIQAAVDAAAAGDVVWVTNGLYQSGGGVVSGSLTNRVVIRKAILVRSVPGPQGAIIEGQGPLGVNAVRCAYLGNGAVLQGFTLRRGCTTLAGNWNLEQSGGGAYVESGCELRDCIIRDNQAYGAGGGVMGFGTMYNCLLTGNRAAQGGGTRDMTAVNCTIAGNEADAGGGVSKGDFRNCIIYYNHHAGSNDNWLVNNGTFTYTCTYPARTGTGNTTNAPQLASLDNPVLLSGSACIDAGSFSLVSGDWDLNGHPRIWGGGVDLGCTEYYPPAITGALAVAINNDYDRAVVGARLQFAAAITGAPDGCQWHMGDGQVYGGVPVVRHQYATAGVFAVVLAAWNGDSTQSVTVRVAVSHGYTNYAAVNGVPAWPFTNWATAAATIQAAVDANIPGGVTLVGPGIYAQGWRKVNTDLPARVVVTNHCVVLALAGPAQTTVLGQPGAGTGAVRGVYLGDQSWLTGFTISNGATRAEPEMATNELSRGGVWCEGVSGVSNCIIAGNTAFLDGGGMYGGACYDGVLQGNSAQRDGGGAYGVQIQGGRVVGNHAGWYGGGVRGGGVRRTGLEANMAGVQGGGAYDAYLENCLVISNVAAYGGGLSMMNGRHLTVAHNSADTYGGGLYWSQVSNAIVYFNTACLGWENYFNSVCRYTCTSPDPDATGSMDRDPLFVLAGAEPFRLLAGSPCVDAGQSNALFMAYDGTPRPLDGTGAGVARWDMGAYEYSRYRYAATNGGNRWPYSTWADAARALQDAVDAAAAGDTVLVSNGIYSSGGRAWAGALSNRLVVNKPIMVRALDGYANTEIRGSGPLGAAAVRGVWLGTGAVLVGFTITNGHTMTDGDWDAQQSGGGVYCATGAIVSNCWITGNQAVRGAGVAQGLLHNCLITENQALAAGGGTWQSALVNCTITRNLAPEGSGVYAGDILNSIVYDNSPSNHAGGAWRYSCTAPWPTGGVAVLTNAPLFAAAEDRNWRLLGTSACVDAGEASAVHYDLAGVGRPLDGLNSGRSAWDLGVFEYVHPLADSDADELSDSNEVANIGTNPAQADTDADGQQDGEEILAETDPLNAASYFAVQWMQQASNDWVLGWASVTARLYSVMSASAPGASWSNQPDAIQWPGTGMDMYYTNRSGNPFMRVLLQRP